MGVFTIEMPDAADNGRFVALFGLDRQLDQQATDIPWKTFKVQGSTFLGSKSIFYDVYKGIKKDSNGYTEYNIAIQILDEAQIMSYNSKAGGSLTVKGSMKIIERGQSTPYNVIGINSSQIKGNHRLNEITFEGIPLAMTPAPFEGCNITKLTFPMGMYLKLGKEGCNNLIDRILEGTTAKSTEIVFQDNKGNQMTMKHENTPELFRNNNRNPARKR